MSPLSPDRAIVETLQTGETAAALRQLLELADDEGTVIYRRSRGLVPDFWPHCLYYCPDESEILRSRAGVPSVVADTFRICAVMRSDALANLPGSPTMLEVLEPIWATILVDIAALRFKTTETGKVWRSHITNHRFEREESATGSDTDPVTIHYLGIEARFLSS